MQKRIPIKNHHYEILLTTRRCFISLVVIICLVILLIVRLAYLQIFMSNVYSTLSTKNWLDLVPIEPTRGLIYDRNGLLLAENIPVFSLDVVPSEVLDMQKTLTSLSKIIALNNDDVNQFRKQIYQHRHFDEVPLKLKLTEQEVARFTENQYRFPGVSIKARLMRHYIYGENFSHVMGYVGRINTDELKEIDQVNYSASHYIGKSGIEKSYEDELHGKVGYQEVENDVSGKPIRILKEIKSIPGKNIYLTLDAKLQFVAEKAMEGHRGAVVAIQPATGQVLAMISEPGYDPNSFVAGISETDYQSLQQSLDKPLYDRALRGLYPLASTIKPYLAIEALETGVTTADDTIYDQGTFQLGNSSHIFSDDGLRGHGIVNISKAIMVSCDIYFYNLAHKMGIKRIDNILTAFGFGAPTGIDLDDELSGIVASPEWKVKTKGVHWYEGDTINSGIGQGFMQATPLQLASAVSTIANRGQRFTPYLLLGSQLPGGAYLTQPPSPTDAVNLHDSHIWDVVINAMQDVVDSPQGTAFRFGHNHSYTLAGKTGTAQVVHKRGDPTKKDNQADLPERLHDHHLFVAFAPVDNPKIAVAIISENSSIAIETARAMFDYYLGTPPHADGQPETKTEKTGA